MSGKSRILQDLRANPEGAALVWLLLFQVLTLVAEAIEALTNLPDEATATESAANAAGDLQDFLPGLFTEAKRAELAARRLMSDRAPGFPT